MNRSALIVEDNKTLAEAFTLTINDRLDYKTVTLNDGQLALDYLKIVQPDLILLDIHLPTVDGVEILSYLQKQSYANRTAIIVLTADILLGEKVAEQFSIVNEILYKPFKLSVLAQKIRQLTEQKLHV